MLPRYSSCTLLHENCFNMYLLTHSTVNYYYYHHHRLLHLFIFHNIKNASDWAGRWWKQLLPDCAALTLCGCAVWKGSIAVVACTTCKRGKLKVAFAGICNPWFEWSAHTNIFKMLFFPPKWLEYSFTSHLVLRYTWSSDYFPLCLIAEILISTLLLQTL